MKPVYLVHLLGCFIFISCSDRVSNENTDQALVAPFTPNLSFIPGDTSYKATSSVKKAVKLNPAHGQPGHRCDIGVGDPLPESPILTSALQSSISPNIPVQASPDTTNSVRFNPQHGMPGHRCDIAVGAPLNSKPTINTAVTPKIPSGSSPNPKHGEPGHRCDIAVGAPLNSKPPEQKLPVQTTNQTPTQILPTQPTDTNSIAKGMNPKHGQPGHRCDIAVGAPLNSKPQTSEQKLPVQTANQTPTQILLTQSTDTNSTAKGMNPKHGQPGHRCDIAVGAPLDSKPSGSTIAKKDLNTNNTQTTSELVKYPVLPNTPSQNIQVQSPATPFISTNATQNTSTGLNPKHGEPGHRCDIAVGAPLNSKPKQ